MGKAEQTQDPEFDEKAALILKLSETAKAMKTVTRTVLVIFMSLPLQEKFCRLFQF